LPIGVEHEANNPEDKENICNDHYHTGGEHFVETLDIVSYSGYESADGSLVIVSEGELVYVVKYFDSDVMEDTLADKLHKINEHELEKSVNDKQAEDKTGDSEKAMPIGLSQVAIDGNFG
jgi:hypothetical protein